MYDRDFLNAGFSEYKPGPFDPSGVEKCFQKRYDDELGKKYFITVKKWSEFRHPSTGDVFRCSYEYDVQLYKKEGHDAIDILFHSTWDLSSVEEYLEKLWDTGLFDYYERT